MDEYETRWFPSYKKEEAEFFGWRATVRRTRTTPEETALVQVDGGYIVEKRGGSDTVDFEMQRSLRLPHLKELRKLEREYARREPKDYSVLGQLLGGGLGCFGIVCIIIWASSGVLLQAAPYVVGFVVGTSLLFLLASWNAKQAVRNEARRREIQKEARRLR